MQSNNTGGRILKTSLYVVLKRKVVCIHEIDTKTYISCIESLRVPNAIYHWKEVLEFHKLVTF